MHKMLMEECKWIGNDRFLHALKYTAISFPSRAGGSAIGHLHFLAAPRLLGRVPYAVKLNRRYLDFRESEIHSRFTVDTSS